jgi:hypothetical protein
MKAGTKVFTTLYRKTPRGMNTKSSGNGVNAKRKMASVPYLLKRLPKKFTFFSQHFVMAFLPLKLRRYPENSPTVPPTVAATERSNGLNSEEPASAKRIALSGTGKKIDAAPSRLIRKIPKYPYWSDRLASQLKMS